MTYVPVKAGEKPEPGVTYRSTYYFKMPYNDTVADTLRRAVDTASGALRLQGIRVLGITTYSPDMTQQTAGGRYQRWRLVVSWEPTSSFAGFGGGASGGKGGGGTY